MDQQALFDELLDLAGRLGIEIRCVPLGGEGGGLCRVREKRVLFIDTQAPLADRLARSAAGLIGQPDLDTSFILPELREFLEKNRQQSPA